MKRIFFIFLAIALLGASLTKAQNVQLHYDLGRHIYTKSLSETLYKNNPVAPFIMANRPAMTATVEGLNFDRWGNTYWFVDFNWQDGYSNGALWEITRSFSLAEKSPWYLQVRYDGGLQFFSTDPSVGGFHTGDAFLLGPNYTYVGGGGNYVVGLSALVRANYTNSFNKWKNFEFKGVWCLNFFDEKLTASGFLSLWREDKMKDKINFKLVTQPQFWVNLNKFDGVAKDFNLSLGTEIRISKDIELSDSWLVCPTIGAKWSFN